MLLFLLQLWFVVSLTDRHAEETGVWHPKPESGNQRVLSAPKRTVFA
jgi:hypothetical protein